MDNIQLQQLLSAYNSAGTGKTTGTSTAQGNSSFAALMASQMMNSSLSGGSSASGEGLFPASDNMMLGNVFTQMSADSLSDMLSGEGDSKNMLMLFCTMLSCGQGMNEGMGAMMASLAKALKGKSSDEVDGLRQSLLSSSEYSYGVRNQANQALFSTYESEDRYPYAAGKAVTPLYTSQPGERNGAVYRRVLDQFNVENNPRYAVNKRGVGDTYCNIYVWDATRAMGAEIPHYIDPATYEPRYYPDTKGARELNVPGMCDWLNKKGGEYGWFTVSDQQAQAMANAGYPVIALTQSHVSMVSPSADGQFDPKRGVAIAQAGSKLINSGYISQVYRNTGSVVYYAHA